MNTLLAANASCVQYLQENCGTTDIPYTGLTLWPIIAAGILLLIVGLCIRTMLDRSSESNKLQ